MQLTAHRAQHPAQIGTTSAASEAPMFLRAEGLKKAFGGQVVLDGVNLELRQGEVVLLRGENGSGKTTLLNILTGNLEPDAGTIHYLADSTPRTYRFPRRWWQELNLFDHFTPEFVALEGVGRTWQDIRLFGSLTLRDNIAVAAPDHPGESLFLALFAPRRSVHREAELNSEADAMLARLGLVGRENSSADKISLGQSKRVAIARTIAAGARILFLDEPLAGLDRQGISDVLDLLKSLVSDHHVTLVIVEHVFNQRYLHGLVTTDWLLANGAIQRVDGNGIGSDSMRSLPTTSLGASFQRPRWFAMLAREDTEVVDEPLARGALLTRIRRREALTNPRKPVMEVRNLVVKRGSRDVVGLDDHGAPTGFSLALYEGEIAVLQAPNGWGKSTLFAAICGLIQPESGLIYLNSKLMNELATWERFREGLRALPSDHHTFPSLLAEEALRLAGNTKAANDLGPLATRPCSALSGGERQLVALCGMTSGAVGLYDEPFAALDERNTSRLRALGSPGTSAQLILVPGQF